MSTLSDVRLNPRTNAVSWRAMDPEIHTIAEFDFCPGQYGFQLQDSVQPSTLILTENITGGSEFDIVTTAPLAGQVYVNFNNGICVFNIADNGKEVISNSYNGGGSNANIQNLGLLASFAGKTTDDLDEGVTNLYYPAADETKLAGIAAGADVTATQVVTASVVNSLIPVLHPHGIFNTKFTAVNNSTTEQSMGIDLSIATFNILCAIRKAGSTGDVEWLSSASAIKITLSTGTVTGTIAGINVTGAYDLYAYAISNNGTLIFGLSRSPYHKSVPSNYTHTNTATARTLVGSASTAWDQMWISISTTINATNSCVCLGLIGTVTFDGTNGRASASTLESGSMPSWDTIKATRPQPYGTTLTNITASSVTMLVWFSAGGSLLHFELTLTTSGSSAGEARASIPSTSASNYPALQEIGRGVNDTVGDDLVVLMEASKAYMTFGIVTSGAFAGLVKRNGNVIFASPQTTSFFGTVRLA